MGCHSDSGPACSPWLARYGGGHGQSLWLPQDLRHQSHRRVRGEHLALLLDAAEHDCRTRRDDTGGEGPGAAEETLEVDTAIVTYDWLSQDLVDNSFCDEDL